MGTETEAGSLRITPTPARLKPAHLTQRKAGGSAIQDHPRVAALAPLNAVEGPMPVVSASSRVIDQDLFPNLRRRTMRFLHGYHARKTLLPGWKLQRLSWGP